MDSQFGKHVHKKNGRPFILIDTYILSPPALIRLLEIRRQMLQKVYLETKTEAIILPFHSM